MTVKWTSFSKFSRAGLTLIEVVGGLALLATVLVSLLAARSRYTRQYHLAERRLAAVAVADQLLSNWWREPEKFPRDDFGEAGTGANRFRWRTRVIPNEEMTRLEAQVVRLELASRGPREDAVVLAVDVVLSKQKPDATPAR